VFLRGKLAIDQNEVKIEKGYGKFVRRLPDKLSA